MSPSGSPVAQASSIDSSLVRSSIRSFATDASPALRVSHGRVGDDLGIGINRDMALVAIEASGGGLVTMTGIGIDRRDDPVDRDLAGNTERGIATILKVLAQNRGQQLPGLGDRQRQRRTTMVSFV